MGLGFRVLGLNPKTPHTHTLQAFTRARERLYVSTLAREVRPSREGEFRWNKSSYVDQIEEAGKTQAGLVRVVSAEEMIQRSRR